MAPIAGQHLQYRCSWLAHMATDPGTTATDGVDRELLHESVYDPGEADSLLTAVTEAIGAALGEHPTELSPPLATVAAWDSLERLMAEDVSAPIEQVGFTYRGLAVVVHRGREVRVYEED